MFKAAQTVQEGALAERLDKLEKAKACRANPRREKPMKRTRDRIKRGIEGMNQK